MKSASIPHRHQSATARPEGRSPRSGWPSNRGNLPERTVKIRKLILVSNRLPVTAAPSEGGFRLEESAGGLATGLAAFHGSGESIWIGWPGVPSDRLEEHCAALDAELLAMDCAGVHLTDSEIRGYYSGYSNTAIWPLFHYFQQYARSDPDEWKAYRAVNRKFADSVAEHAQPGDIVWIHDYHLMLLPGLLRERLEGISIGFFLHIPFPSFELFRLLPERNEIIRGLLGADLVGFHSYDYARHFLSAALRLCGHDQQLGHIDVDGRAVRVDVFPMSIDFGRFSRAPDTPGVRSEASRLREEIGDRKLILSVDRLDYTKGLLQRLEAYDLFLRDNSRYRDRVVLSLLVVPSRTSVPQYEQLKHELDEAIGRIASAYGGITTSPVLCHFGTVAFDTLAALYGIADVALVTPIRDGMNLVAKEYVATRSDERGALVLSEMAGAAMELGEALQVNPMDCHGVANAILLALEMPAEEQAARMAAMRKRIARYDVSRWAGDFVEQLEQTATTAEDGIPRLDGESKADMLSSFRESARRLLFLDYDGTLVPFRERPDKACPDDLVRELLSRLAAREGTRVVVVSGRDRETLDRFLRSLPIGLVAEHGAWLAERPGSWRQFRPLRSDWKSEIRSLMEFYVDRTPGAMVEEKAYSLAWHYRMTQPDLGRVRSRSLLVDLYSRTAGMKLDVLEGSRVIEVRNAEINKGEAALAFLRNGRWGFVLALGDDLTDEDLFRAMPRRAWTIKVGRGETRARHRLKDPDAVRAVLEELCEEEENG